MTDSIEPTIAHWIAVTDRLPENGSRVLVCVSGCPDVAVVTYYKGRFGESLSDYGDWIERSGDEWDPTHWAPLPEGPK